MVLFFLVPPPAPPGCGIVLFLVPPPIPPGCGIIIPGPAPYPYRLACYIRRWVSGPSQSTAQSTMSSCRLRTSSAHKLPSDLITHTNSHVHVHTRTSSNLHIWYQMIIIGISCVSNVHVMDINVMDINVMDINVEL